MLLLTVLIVLRPWSKKAQLVKFRAVGHARAQRLSGRSNTALQRLNLPNPFYSRGRLILLEVIDVVPEPGKPLTRYKYKTVFDASQRGPVSAVDSLDGALIAAIGQKVFIHAFQDDNLRATGFVDTQVSSKY